MSDSRWFHEVNGADVGVVGGKGANKEQREDARPALQCENVRGVT